MMIYVSLAGGKWRRLWRKIITINFLNIHLDYTSIFFLFFFFGGEEGEGGGGRLDRGLGSLKACCLNGTIK